MKKYLLSTITGLLLAAAGTGLLASEDQTKPMAESAQATAPASGAGMMPMMQKMKQQMAKIQATGDPKERRRLMAEHMKSMQAMMSSMGNHPMMGNGMMGMGMRGNQSGMMGSRMGEKMSAQQDTAGNPAYSMTNRMNRMAERLDAMQAMMDQMLQHQAAAKEDTK